MWSDGDHSDPDEAARGSPNDLGLEPGQLTPRVDAGTLDKIDFWCLYLYFFGFRYLP